MSTSYAFSHNAMLPMKRAVAKIFFALFTVLTLVLTPLAANASGKTVIDHGHTDAFFVDITDEKPVVMIRNGLGSTTYNIENTEILIHAQSYSQEEKCVNGALSFLDDAYYPQLGEDTKLGYYGGCSTIDGEPGMAAPGQAELGVKEVKIKFTRVSGPGRIGFFNNNEMGGIADDGSDLILPFMKSGNYFINAGDEITVPGHQHGKWYFEHAGVYQLTGRAIMTKNDGSTVRSEPFTLTYRVEKSEKDTRETPQARVLSEIADNEADQAAPTPESPSDFPPAGDGGENQPPAPGAGTGANPANPSQPNQPNQPQLPDESAGDPNAQATPVPDTPNVPNVPGVQDVKPGNTPLAPNATARLVLPRGHIDLFNVISQNGKLILNAKDDTTGKPVLRTPEEIIVHVNQHAKMTLPAEFAKKLGEKAGADFSAPLYFLGQNGDQQHLTPFPGWDTSAVAPDFSEIKLQFMEVTGPGKVYLYDSVGTRSQLASQGFELKSGEEIHQKYPAHVHTNWIFTKPGAYTMTVRAIDARDGSAAALPGLAGVLYTPGRGVSNTATYTWYVGNTVPQGLIDGTANPAEIEPDADDLAQNPGVLDNSAGDPANSNLAAQELPGVNTPGAPQNGGGQSQGAPAAPTNSPAGAHSGAASDGASATPAVQSAKYVDAIFPRIKDDRTQPPKWVDPASLVFAIGNAGKATIPEGVGRIPAGTNVWMISSSQVAGVPWLGFNSQHPSLLAKTTGHLRLALTSFSGPGEMEVYYSNNFGGAGQRIFSGANGSAAGAIVLAPNVHSHPNWVFTKPGTYRVGITTTATLKSGKTISNQAVLTFNVGQGGGATHGHFDFGAEIGTALAGTAGTQAVSGAGGASLVGTNAARQGKLAGAGQGGKVDANGNPITDDNPAVQSLTGAKLGNASAAGALNDAPLSSGFWNTNTLLGVIIGLLLVNGALMTVRIMQGRSKE